MCENNKYEFDELDNLMNAYLINGGFKFSEEYKMIYRELEDFFNELVLHKVISKSKAIYLSDRVNDIVCESGRDGFKQGFAIGVDLKKSVINIRQKSKI